MKPEKVIQRSLEDSGIKSGDWVLYKGSVNPNNTYIGEFVRFEEPSLTPLTEKDTKTFCVLKTEDKYFIELLNYILIDRVIKIVTKEQDPEYFI